MGFLRPSFGTGSGGYILSNNVVLQHNITGFIAILNGEILYADVRLSSISEINTLQANWRKKYITVKIPHCVTKVKFILRWSRIWNIS